MGRIKVSHYRIKIPDRIGRPRQAFSMVVLADLHNASFGMHQKNLMHVVEKIAPKQILLAGDMVISKRGRLRRDAALELIKELTCRYPVCAVNGNHECRMEEYASAYGTAGAEWMEQVQGLGVRLLRNERYDLDINHAKLSLFGYEPDWKYYCKGRGPAMQTEEMDAVLGRPAGERFNILLAHHPGYFDTYASWGADLTLSGHVHGGMIRLPLLGGVIGPDLIPFPRYDHGRYVTGKRTMIVSAGLAGHSMQFRVNNPPEVVVLDVI